MEGWVLGLIVIMILLGLYVSFVKYSLRRGLQGSWLAWILLLGVYGGDGGGGDGDGGGGDGGDGDGDFDLDV